MRFLLAITGASGIIYGKRTYEVLKQLKHDVDVVASEGAKKVAEAEDTVLPDSDYEEKDISAPFASGSHKCDGMIVSPCSVKTLGEIANGVGNTLITRSAEVMLKERRKLVLVLRETPYSYITIKNMETLTLAGGIILPASPGFYYKPKSIDGMVDFIVGKTLDQFDIEHNLFRRWGR
ncbi:UbiX family flavin prenyltransferase [Candidatus Micrarchaeota archaeon]|nr:UbiX family flavin prenyltransferase [Candidatus Micrarchaeota archaeon]